MVRLSVLPWEDLTERYLTLPDTTVNSANLSPLGLPDRWFARPPTDRPLAPGQENDQPLSY